MQCYDTMVISNALILAVRQLYIFFYPEEIEGCPWQKALLAGVYCGLLLIDHSKIYMSLYVHVNKCDS